MPSMITLILTIKKIKSNHLPYREMIVTRSK